MCQGGSHASGQKVKPGWEKTSTPYYVFNDRTPPPAEVQPKSLKHFWRPGSTYLFKHLLFCCSGTDNQTVTQTVGLYNCSLHVCLDEHSEGIARKCTIGKRNKPTCILQNISYPAFFHLQNQSTECQREIHANQMKYFTLGVIDKREPSWSAEYKTGSRCP